jgi:4-hydroxy-3-methylbut-2-enyl diphosphate reductase
MTLEIRLANPRGFCAGVERAIEIVERALAVHGAPLYVRHEVVHNRHVVQELRDQGVIFIEDLAEVPMGNVVVFSAHGVSLRVQEEARQRGLLIYDATCPLVTKVHHEVRRYVREGRDVILIGHAGHPEVEGTLGQLEPGQQGQVHLVEQRAQVAQLQVRDPAQLAYVSQTTLSLDDTAEIIEALQARFPEIQGPRKMDICYATQNRQNAVKMLVRTADLLLVVGSPTSSNSTRLCEIGRRAGIESYLVEDHTALDPRWLVGKRYVAITAGASAPERLVQELVTTLRAHGVERVEEVPGELETVTFAMLPALRLN